MEDCVCLSHTKKCSWPESQGCVEETLLSLHVSGSQSSVLSLHTWLLLSHGDVCKHAILDMLSWGTYIN